MQTRYPTFHAMSRLALGAAVALAAVTFAASNADAQSRGGGRPGMSPGGGGGGGWSGGGGGGGRPGGGWSGGGGGGGSGWQGRGNGNPGGGGSGWQGRGNGNVNWSGGGGGGGGGHWQGRGHGNWSGGGHGHGHGGRGHWHGGRGHWHGGGGYWGGHGYYGGRYYYPGWALGLGVGIGLTYPWWGWGGYPYAYSYPTDYAVYDAPAGVVLERDALPPAASQPPAAPAAPAYRWYCPSPAGYHPDVVDCAAGWLKVVPQNGGPGPAPRSDLPEIAPTPMGNAKAPARIAAPRMSQPVQLARVERAAPTLAHSTLP